MLVRNWPLADPTASFIWDVFSRTQGYAVASGDGLTVTSRATSGVLAAIDTPVNNHPDTAPLLAVLAACAAGTSRLRSVDPPTAAVLARNLAALGGHAHIVEKDLVGLDLVIEPRPLTGGVWHASGAVGSVLAAAVLGLLVPGIEVPEWDLVEVAFRGFTSEWLRMISCDEYLMPGSAKLPRDYLS